MIYLKIRDMAQKNTSKVLKNMVLVNFIENHLNHVNNKIYIYYLGVPYTSSSAFKFNL